MKKLALLLTILSPLTALGEYRAYQYLVKSNDPYAVATNARAQYIVSTLNPQMYKSYHGGSFVTIDLLRTWICPGYTGKGQPICDHPYDKENPVQ
ncbi:MAG: hypothetical protein ACLGHN_00575 [Bacteriovoracia bacterium]